MSRVVAYVDGENHFIRTREAFREAVSDPEVSLESAHVDLQVGSAPCYPDEREPMLVAKEDTFFFWDKHAFMYLERMSSHTVSMYARDVTRGIYASSIVGDLDKAHEAKVWVRNQGFDPLIQHESSNLRKRRVAGAFKAKTVDVTLAVRMLEDAYNDVFDVCYLFTSDVDFVPALRVLRRLGKQIIVCGYQNAIGKRSELEHVPDAFADLTDRVGEYGITE